MLSQNHGTTVVSDTVGGAGGLQTLVTRTGSTYYVTVINTVGTPNTTTINLAGVTSVSSTATATTMSALSSSATNSITNPTNIVPVTSTVSGLAPTFSYTFAGYSITILQFNAIVDTPTVATPASANPIPVTGTTTNLSVLGADAIGEPNLTYIWTDTGPATVNFSANGNNAAKNTIATFTAAGTYTFTVTITNPTVGTSVTSSVNVTVNQTSNGFAVTPSATTVVPGGTVQFSAGTVDQFGKLMAAQSATTWSVISGSGTINSAGVYTAGATPGAVTVRATTTGNTSATATVTIPTAVAWYQANASSGTTLADSSGNSETGTLTGAAAFGPGISGNALSLTGGSATLPTALVSNVNDFTISAWINVTTLANWARVFDFGSGTGSYMFLTPDAGGTNALRFAITTNTNANEQMLNGPAITPGVWTHVAVTLAGTTGTLYVNGVAVATNTNITDHPAALGHTTQDYLGKSQFTGDPNLTGSIDDFRIYGQALSAAQILQLAAPSVANPAAASAAPVTTSHTILSVLGADVTAGEAALIYTWATMGTPPAAVTFSINGTNAAKNTTATFTAPGTHNFLVTMTNPAGLTTTSPVTVIVSQTATTLTFNPTPATLYAGASEQLTVTGVDQFGATFTPLNVTWSLTGGGGTLTTGGIYTAPACRHHRQFPSHLRLPLRHGRHQHHRRTPRRCQPRRQSRPQ